MSTKTVYRIVGWRRTYEKAQGRKCEKMLWVPMPTQHDGNGYCTIMARDDGLTLYGTWALVVQLVARLPVRGLLASQSGPITARYFSVTTRAPEGAFELAIRAFSSPEVGWLEAFEWDFTNGIPPETVMDADITELRAGRVPAATGSPSGSQTGSPTPTLPPPQVQVQVQVEKTHVHGGSKAGDMGLAPASAADPDLETAQKRAFAATLKILPAEYKATETARSRIEAHVSGIIYDAWTAGGVERAKVVFAAFLLFIGEALSKPSDKKPRNAFGWAKKKLQRQIKDGSL